MKSKTITISNADKSNFKIIFDGENKTNTIFAENGSYIVTPFYNREAKITLYGLFKWVYQVYILYQGKRKIY